MSRTLVTPHFAIEDWTSSKDGIAYPADRIDEEDPQGRTWLITRLTPLCQTAEVIRAATGSVPIKLTGNGGYRTEAHQEAILEAHPEDADAGLVASPTTSQHPQGRAADIFSLALSARDLHRLIQTMFFDGRLPLLGGLGLYPSFVHIDVRQRPNNDHLAQWTGVRRSNMSVA
jgi:hypothetical protein